MPAGAGLGRRIVSDSIITLSVRVGSIVVAAAVGILVSRTLGPEGRAYYQLPGIMAGLVTAFFSGLATATCYTLLNLERGRGALHTALVAACIFTAGGMVVIVPLGLAMHAEWAIAAAAVSLPLTAIVNVATGYWYGVSNVRYANYLGFAITAAIAVAVASGFALFGPSVQHAIVMWLTGTGVMTALALTGVILHARRLPNAHAALGPFLVYAAKVGLVNLVSLLNYRVDVYIVAMVLPPHALGLYTVAITGAETLNVFAQIGASVTLPYITALERAPAAELTARCARISVALAVVMAAAAWFAAPSVVVALYGAAFRDSVPAFRALLGGGIALAAGGVVASYFTLNRGQPSVALVLSALMAVEGAVLTFVLVPAYGIAGAGLATTISYGTGYALFSLAFTGSGGGSAFALAIIRPSDVRSIVRHLRTLVSRHRVAPSEAESISA